MDFFNQNMNLMGRTPGVIYHLGMPVFKNTNAGTTKRIFTKKQTRKFKNTRWVKKYKKMHSYTEFIPGAIFDKINQCFYMHPIALEALGNRI